jgi:hypothetical protein
MTITLACSRPCSPRALVPRLLRQALVLLQVADFNVADAVAAVLLAADAPVREKRVTGRSQRPAPAEERR